MSGIVTNNFRASQPLRFGNNDNQDKKGATLMGATGAAVAGGAVGVGIGKFKKVNPDAVTKKTNEKFNEFGDSFIKLNNELKEAKADKKEEIKNGLSDQQKNYLDIDENTSIKDFETKVDNEAKAFEAKKTVDEAKTDKTDEAANDKKADKKDDAKKVDDSEAKNVESKKTDMPDKRAKKAKSTKAADDAKKLLPDVDDIAKKVAESKGEIADELKNNKKNNVIAEMASDAFKNVKKGSMLKLGLVGAGLGAGAYWVAKKVTSNNNQSV